MIRLLGRQTSGNVQKVIFCLEELGVPYVREDYGRQFGNTLTDAYRKLNRHRQGPDLDRRRPGDLVSCTPSCVIWRPCTGPTLTGATPAERTMVERSMDFLLGALNTPYVAVFTGRQEAARRTGRPISRRKALTSWPSSRSSTGISLAAIGSRSTASPSPTWRSARS